MATRYDNNTILFTEQSKPYVKGKVYPNIPLSQNDIYVVTTIGDRLDSLAYAYYKDVNMWWVIAVANNNITKGSMFPIPGTQLRIPLNVSNIMQLFNQFNQAR